MNITVHNQNPDFIKHSITIDINTKEDLYIMYSLMNVSGADAAEKIKKYFNVDVNKQKIGNEIYKMWIPIDKIAKTNNIQPTQF